MGGSPSPPPAPDYAASAREQGAANVQAARLSGKLNNPNVYSPTGTQTIKFGEFNQGAYDAAVGDFEKRMREYSAAGNVGTAPIGPVRSTYETAEDQPSMYQTYSPEQQRLYEQDVATRQQVGKLGLQGANALEGVIGTNLDYSSMAADPTVYQGGAAIAPSAAPQGVDINGLPLRAGVGNLSPLDLQSLPGRAGLSAAPAELDRGGLPATPSTYVAPGNLPPMPSPSNELYDRTYAATMARPLQDLAIQRDDRQSNLIAKGIRSGSRAYGDEMTQQDRAENDARMQGVLAANQAVQQQYSMDLSTRQQAQQEALANAGLSYQQGMGTRQQSVDEQMRQFEQQMSMSGRTYEQQQALRNQAASEQAGQFAQQAQAAGLSYEQQQALRNQALNEQGVQFQQGLTGGAQTFAQQMQAQQQAASQASVIFQQQSDLRRQQIAEYLAMRQTPLNEISAALSQTQVQNPFSMPGYSQNSNIAPPPIFAAAQAQESANMDRYNAAQQAAASKMSGLTSLGGAAIGAAGMFAGSPTGAASIAGMFK